MPGASGISAHGETDAAPFFEHALPDVLGADRDRFAGKRVLVVGAGYSAANTLLLLADLADQAPGTQVTWAIRATSPARTYSGETADALPARGALGTVLREHVEAGTIQPVTGFAVQSITPQLDSGVELSDGTRTVTADRVVSATAELVQRHRARCRRQWRSAAGQRQYSLPGTPVCTSR